MFYFGFVAVVFGCRGFVAVLGSINRISTAPDARMRPAVKHLG
jgi:hypothetical protein